MSRDAKNSPEESSNGLRCLLIASNFPPITGGSAVVYYNMATYSEGRTVVLATTKDYKNRKRIDGLENFDEVQPFQIYRLPYVRVPKQSKDSTLFDKLLAKLHDASIRLSVFWKILYLCRRHSIDVLCIGELNTLGWLVKPFQRLTGKPSIIYTHAEEFTAKSRWITDEYRRKLLHACSGVVTVSSFSKDTLVNDFQLAEDSVHLIPNGVDTIRFCPGEFPQSLQARLGIKGKRVLLTVARLVERKGIDMVLSALPDILERHPNTHYVVVGTGPDEARLHSIVAEKNLEESVTFAGRVEDAEVAEYYRLADAFVMPNRTLSDGNTEGFGLVFLEANACGLPVISGRDGGVLEAVQHGVNGLTVNGSQKSEIVEAVCSIFENEELYQGLKAGGLEVAAHSSWQHRVQKFERVLSHIQKTHATG